MANRKGRKREDRLGEAREEMTSKAKEQGGRNRQERKAQQEERMKGKVDKSIRKKDKEKDKEQDKGEMPESITTCKNTWRTQITASIFERLIEEFRQFHLPHKLFEALKQRNW